MRLFTTLERPSVPTVTGSVHTEWSRCPSAVTVRENVIGAAETGALPIFGGTPRVGAAQVQQVTQALMATPVEVLAQAGIRVPAWSPAGEQLPVQGQAPVQVPVQAPAQAQLSELVARMATSTHGPEQPNDNTDNYENNDNSNGTIGSRVMGVALSKKLGVDARGVPPRGRPV